MSAKAAGKRCYYDFLAIAADNYAMPAIKKPRGENRRGFYQSATA
ncbi:hypothetical protein RNAN_0543 [Rheinheimera nanhaiensis E407-8]|uniref:Uncharacterized protein n=1 Tax=Rheinheimera nanhaiensis E407-8 TaxID=562729 RepID=I1DU46_9GAMM|nr:hypothetical protein RNAN_0543 [Rheinheimera nanhaiensis E407-8]